MTENLKQGLKGVRHVNVRRKDCTESVLETEDLVVSETGAAALKLRMCVQVAQTVVSEVVSIVRTQNVRK